MANKISVLLVDDHALVRKGFRRMLEDDPAIVVVGESSDGTEAVRQALELRPKVVVMDCALPGISGIEAARQIREKFPEALILMLSMHSEETLVRQALEAGTRGYILKNAVDLDLVSAIKRVADGKMVLDPQLAKSDGLKGERESRIDGARAGSLATHRGGPIQQGNCGGTQAEREYRGGASGQHYGCAGNP